MLTVIALMCHLVTVNSALAPMRSCHEVEVVKGLPMQACAFAQAGIAQWKANSPYSASEWTVEGYKCAFGSGYVLKDDRA